MTLTTDDLLAIKGAVNDAVDQRLKPALDDAVEHKVKPLITEAIDELSLQVGAGFNEVSERFDRAEADVAELKLDVAELKTDVAVLKDDVSVLKTDVAELKTDMREVKWSLADTVRRAEFLDVRRRVERLEQRSA